jgi:hypothetical protein
MCSTRNAASNTPAWEATSSSCCGSCLCTNCIACDYGYWTKSSFASCSRPSQRCLGYTHSAAAAACPQLAELHTNSKRQLALFTVCLQQATVAGSSSTSTAAVLVTSCGSTHQCCWRCCCGPLPEPCGPAAAVPGGCGEPLCIDRLCYGEASHNRSLIGLASAGRCSVAVTA